jgi:hypothetical protein
MGEVFSWKNEVKYASVVGGAGPAGPRRQFKIANYSQNILITIQKNPPGSNRVQGTGRKYFFNYLGLYPGASEASFALEVERKVLEFKKAVISEWGQARQGPLQSRPDLGGPNQEAAD